MMKCIQPWAVDRLTGPDFPCHKIWPLQEGVLEPVWPHTSQEHPLALSIQEPQD
jgi:hypothetical protein